MARVCTSVSSGSQRNFYTILSAFALPICTPTSVMTKRGLGGLSQKYLHIHSVSGWWSRPFTLVVPMPLRLTLKMCPCLSYFSWRQQRKRTENLVSHLRRRHSVRDAAKITMYHKAKSVQLCDKYGVEVTVFWNAFLAYKMESQSSFPWHVAF